MKDRESLFNPVMCATCGRIVGYECYPHFSSRVYAVHCFDCTNKEMQEYDRKIALKRSTLGDQLYVVLWVPDASIQHCDKGYYLLTFKMAPWRKGGYYKTPADVWTAEANNLENWVKTL